jgi:ABC-type branched-subunit amino acid transport system substrate-binding protein
MSMKIGIIAPLSGEYNYFGIPIHNGAVLALQEAIDAGDDIEFIAKDDAGERARTRECIKELDEAGVLAIVGPVESHSAAIGAEESRARRLPVITPSATASYLTAEPNPWFFRAISPDKDRTDALARWAKQDLRGEPILVIHEITPPGEVADHPPLYGESAARDFLDALQAGTEEPYPYEVITFERDDVLSRALKQKSAQLLQSGSVSAAAILSPTTNIIEIGTYLRQLQRDLPIYIISPGRDLFERSSLRDGVKAVTDTGIEDAGEPELAAFRRQYRSSFPYDTEDPVHQYATFAYDAGRILVAALRSDAVAAAAQGDLGQRRDVVREALRKSPPRSDLLMSPGNFVLNNDLFFKPSRRVLERSEWNKVRIVDLREALRTAPAAADSLRAAVTAGFDAFLSYRHGDPDEEFTRGLRRRLLDAGLKVAIDHVDFYPAFTFLEEMERCVRDSRFTIAVISPRYFESGNTQEEAIITQVLGMDDRKRRLIPLILETATMPAWLYSIVGIDFSRIDPDVDPYVRLIAALNDPRGSQ